MRDTLGASWYMPLLTLEGSTSAISCCVDMSKSNPTLNAKTSMCRALRCACFFALGRARAQSSSCHPEKHSRVVVVLFLSFVFVSTRYRAAGTTGYGGERGGERGEPEKTELAW